ncbi:uncharacterized protein A1O9_09787 [Exophiala aquamarina CBS 119918]|uniref:Uncharacterized protein n=1 Tax=Exophiala aquamarina CBS 119918 TaxID=1182545 RepID=A0A072P2R6_9EURO|nr:uncharacterized protein A1O9_09787 [Exophiala aquamarina CBS 119918]KEF53992.1 hypothetical protein A1O9_09787 [Exophiala aquamarina CBS 119918]
MASGQPAYVGLEADDNDLPTDQHGTQSLAYSSNMIFPKTAYVGVSLDDDIDTVNVDVRSIQSSRTQASGFSRLTQTSYRSNIALFTTQAHEQASHAASTMQQNFYQLFSREFWRTLPSHSKSWWQEAYADVKTLRLRHQLWRFTNVIGPIAIIIALIVVMKIVTLKDLYPVHEACRPDSGFYVGDAEYNIWARDGFFQITLAFGEFPFSTAKIIDVAWDIVVGRGGQGILVWVCFVVYGKALVRSMESTSVSFGTFEAITLQSGSVTGSLKLARDLLKHPSIQARFMVFWVITSAIFVLSFPTMASAMSGYAANIKSYVDVGEGDMVGYASFSLVRYIIHDGDRLGGNFGKDYKVLVGKYSERTEIVDVQESEDCIAPYYPHQNYGVDDLELDWSDAHAVPECEFYWHVSEYAFNYGFLGMNQTNSTFNNSGTIINLPSPALNISAIFWNESWISAAEDADWWYYPYGVHWKSPSGDTPFARTQQPLFSNGEFTFEIDKINELGRCQQSNTSYKWGFSFLILFVVLLLFAVWCVGMYALWIDAFLHSRVDNAGRHIGLQRAVLDLAHVMRNDIGDDLPEMASNNQVNEKVRKDLKGGRISYQMLNPEFMPMSRWTEFRLRCRAKGSIKAWAKAEWPWIAFFLLSVGFLASAIGGTHAPVFTAFFLCYGSASALYAGSSHKGRWLVFLVCCAVAIILGPIGPYVYLDKNHYGVVWLRDDAYYALSWWYG